jgi:hypothetical protein
MVPMNEMVYTVDDDANVGEALSTLLCANGKHAQIFTSGAGTPQPRAQGYLRLPDLGFEDARTEWIGSLETDRRSDNDSGNFSHGARGNPVDGDCDERTNDGLSHKTRR